MPVTMCFRLSTGLAGGLCSRGIDCGIRDTLVATLLKRIQRQAPNRRFGTHRARADSWPATAGFQQGLSNRAARFPHAARFVQEKLANSIKQSGEDFARNLGVKSSFVVRGRLSVVVRVLAHKLV